MQDIILGDEMLSQVYMMSLYKDGCLYGERILHGSLLHGSYAWKVCMGRRLRNK